MLISPFLELFHYGIPGMKKGVRRGPPYPIGSNKKSKYDVGKSVVSKYADKKIKDLRSFKLSKKEHRHVSSEIMTWMKKENRFEPSIFSHRVGPYSYMVESFGDGTFKILSKRKIK